MFLVHEHYQGLRLRLHTCAGTLPDSWAQLPELNGLHISNNSLRGTLPAPWGTGLPKLDTLDLRVNSLSGEPQSTALPGLSPWFSAEMRLECMCLRRLRACVATLVCSGSSLK